MVSLWRSNYPALTMFFLLVALLFGALAFNVHNPVLHRQKLTVPSFVAGWLTGELALHAIALQAVIVLLFYSADAIEGFTGSLGMLIVLGGWLSLWRFHRDAAELPRSLGAALDAGLGPDWRSELSADTRAGFETYLDTRAHALPFQPVAPAVEVIKNVPFGDYGQTLDIYRKRGADLKNAPVLLQIHGGAWTENLGSKNEQALPLMSHMADRHGWICVATSYRLSPTATFPEHIVDCKQALVWIRDHITDYGGDPDFVAVTGGSAGGHLSSLLALTPNVPAFQPGFEDRDTSVVAAVPFYGMYDFVGEYSLDNSSAQAFIEDTVMKCRVADDIELFRQASPLHNVSADAPPFLTIHGTNDSLVALAHGRALHAKLQAVSAQPSVYFEVPGAQHAFDMFASPRSTYVKQAVAQFLTWVHETHTGAKPPLLEAVAEVPLDTSTVEAAATPTETQATEPEAASDPAVQDSRD